MSVIPFAREFLTVPSAVDFSANLVNGEPQLPEWFELPSGGTIVFKDGTGTSRTFTDLPAGYRMAAQLRELTSCTGVVRVGTNAITAMAPSAPSAIAPGSLAGEAADPDGIAPLLQMRVAFTAGTTGTADDVTILASAPFGFHIVDAFLHVSTAKASETGTLRSATAGGGTALSDAWSTTSTGVVRNSALTAPAAVAAESAIYLRRSDRAFAGTVVLVFAKD